MAESVNYVEEYSDIEFRYTQVTNLLRARCYVLSMRNDMLSSETLKLIRDTHEELDKLKTYTVSLYDLSKRKKLNRTETGVRISLDFQWNNLKDEINNSINTLEDHSNLLRSVSAPSSVNVLSILSDLEMATFIYMSNQRRPGAKPRK